MHPKQSYLWRARGWHTRIITKNIFFSVILLLLQFGTLTHPFTPPCLWLHLEQRVINNTCRATNTMVMTFRLHHGPKKSEKVNPAAFHETLPRGLVTFNMPNTQKILWHCMILQELRLMTCFPSSQLALSFLPLSLPPVLLLTGRAFYSLQVMPMCLFLLKTGVTEIVLETGVQARNIHAEAWFIKCLSKAWVANIEKFKGGNIAGLNRSAKAVHMYRLGFSPNITSLPTAVVYLIKSYRLIIFHN